MHFDDLESGNVTSLIVDGQRLYVANTHHGLLRSDDDGENWIPVNLNASFNFDITCLLKADTFLFAGTKSGALYRSSDGGVTWVDLPSKHAGAVKGLGVHAKKLFVSIDSIYRSSDWGNSWVSASMNVNPGHQFASIGNNVFTISSEAGCFRSTNNGDMWYWLPIAGPNGVNGTAMIAIGTNLLMGIGGQGIWRTTNLGQTWSRQDAFLNENVTAFAVYQNTVFATLTGLGGVIQSLDSGVTWTPINQGLSGFDVRKTACSDEYLFIWLDQGGFWRRPLAELAVDAEANRSAMQVTLYPNPSVSTCTIEYTLETPSPVTITVLDMGARPVINLMEHGQSGTQSLQIDTRTLPEGSYLVSIAAEGARVFKVLQVCR